MKKTGYVLMMMVALLSTNACKKKVNPILEGNRDAQDQLTALQSEVMEKIKTENAYYDSVMDNMEADVARTRSIEMALFLNSQSENFVKANMGRSDAQLPLSTFVTSSVADWKVKEAKLQQLIDETEAQMAANRKKVEADMSKVKALKAKLQSLEAQETRKARMKALAGFLSDSYKDYKKLKEAPAAGGNN